MTLAAEWTISEDGQVRRERHGQGRSPRHQRHGAAYDTPRGVAADGRFGPRAPSFSTASCERSRRTRLSAAGWSEPWDAEAVAEIAHDFLADERTPKRLAHLAVHAVDDDSFDRLLHRMVLNFLRDGGRRTETGRLMLRLRDVLGRDDEFVAEPDDRWRLRRSLTPSTCAPAVLVEAAAAEPHVDVPRWSPQTRRRPPVADAASLERLCRRVLEPRPAPCRSPSWPSRSRPGSAWHRPDRPSGRRPRPVRPHRRVRACRRRARRHAGGRDLLGLDQRERLLLAAAGTPVRELRSVIGVGPSQAAELQARLRALLAVELRDDEGYEAVFFHLIDQAKAWATPRSSGQPDAIPRLTNTT